MISKLLVTTAQAKEGDICDTGVRKMGNRGMGMGRFALEEMKSEKMMN